MIVLASIEYALKRFGAGDDLDQFLGDHRLARAVVGDGLLADHFAGIAGRVVHRAHARALLRRGVLQQRAEDLHGDVARQELVEDVDFLRLVFVGGRRARRPSLPSNTGGMICCAVGICAITDLKREKNSVRRRTRPR